MVTSFFDREESVTEMTNLKWQTLEARRRSSREIYFKRFQHEVSNLGTCYNFAWELNDVPGKLYPRYCDVTNEESIVSAFKWTSENLGGVDILINNAGVMCVASPIAGATEDWRRALEVNVLGLSICTREAVQDMLSRGLDDGFIIHICSLAGCIPTTSPEYSMYFASKAAVRALLEGLRIDLLARKSHIRVGEVCPALVKTEIQKTLSEDQQAMWDSPCLQPADVASTVLFMLAQDPRVQVSDVIIRATGSLF